MKKKKILLVSILLSLILLIGGTLAWVSWSLDKTSMTLTIGSAEKTILKINPYVSNQTLTPVAGMDYTVDDDNDSTNDNYYITVEATNNKTVDSLFGLYFKIKNIDTELVDEGMVYVVRKSIDGGTTYTQVATGNFLNATNYNRMYILEDTIPTNTTYYYRVYFYIDGTSTNQATMSGKSLDLELRGSLEQTGSYVKVLANANDDLIYKVNHNAISSSNSVTGGDITSTVDYRYYGVNPNNYVCLDYEGANTCPDKHLYRIIGIIRNDRTGNQELKLIKANPLVDDNSTSTFAWDTNGSNNWTSSSLLTILNTNYLNKTNTFATNGLSDTAKELLSENTYYLGGTNATTGTPDTFYSYEHGTTIITNGTIDSYIGLMYPSDYGYASSKTCTLDTSCNTKNWMPNTYTITPVTGANTNAYYIDTKLLSNQAVTTTYAINPILYLSNDVEIKSGLGTITYPYAVKKILPKLYDVLKLAAEDGTYAVQYTGQHQDDFLGTRSTKNIYHWKAVANSAGTADQNGTAITDMYNVVFAGMCWQMIRTTDTGGVRLLYNGEPTIGTSNGKTTYDCGTTRPGHIAAIRNRSTVGLSGSYYYGDGYTTSVSGNTTTFTLTNETPITVSAGNASSKIADIVQNHPYTCRKKTAGTNCTTLYKVDSQSSGVNVYVYASTLRDRISSSSFSSPNSFMAYVGYMYNSSTLLETSSFSMSTKSLTVNSSSSYLIGDSLINNSDGTISLSGNVTEVAGSTWSSDYANYTSKFVCLPGYYNATTYVCSDTRTTNDVQAVGYITATTGTNMTYRPVYKYGNGIALDSGTKYKLVGDGSTQNKLQYIYNWDATATSSCFASDTYYTNGNISSCGYKSINYSHYTCFNLSGRCSTYYYINYTTTSAAYMISISGGKYVSTDVTDTNNVLYDMLYAPNVNTNDSIIKENIDTWYENNLYTNYDRYIDDTIYCNDRTITSFGGWNPNGGSVITALTFKESTVSTDLSCTRDTDKFSYSNNVAKLTYKVGLISAPEMNLLNNKNARASADYYWLFSPKDFSSFYASVCYVFASGVLSSSIITNNNGVRPAVSLVSGLGYSQGDGSMTNPYVVDAPPTNNR